MLKEERTNTTYPCNYLFERAKITGQKVVFALSSYVLIFNFVDTANGRWNCSVREDVDPPVLSILTGCSASSHRNYTLEVRTPVELNMTLSGLQDRSGNLRGENFLTRPGIQPGPSKS